MDAPTSLEVYDPAANTWTSLAPMRFGRNHCGGAFIGGQFYVVAGRGSVLAPSAAATALGVYDPATNLWTTLAPMPTGRSGVAVAAVGGELFVFGGELPDLHAEVEAYNPATNSWRQLPSMPAPRHGIWASVIGNRVYLPGGGEAQGFAASSVNDVFTVGESTPPPVAPATVSVVGDAGRGGFVVSRQSADLGQTLVVFYHVGGAAISDSDYETLPGSLTFDPGQPEAVIPVRLLPGVNRNRKVKVFLDANPAYGIGKAQSKVFLSDLP